nr:phosphatase PAP2 family protein [uncultured Cellulosilyticum sp.]
MEIQIQILQYLEQIRTESLTLLMTMITMMAETLFISAIIASLYWCVDKAKSKRLAWMIFCSTGVNGIVKNIIKMPRPFQVGVVSPIRVQTATSYSFPSGHTQAATSFWGSSMLVLKRKPVIWVGCIMIALTALSRMYLGVHWPMDVVGGILFGIASIIVANRLMNEEGEITRWHILGTSIAFIIVLIFNVDGDLYKAIASIWGFSVGAFIEQKYIRFNPIQPRRIQIIKVIVGIVGLIIFQVGLKKIFPAGKPFDMIRYAIVMLWALAGAPYCFKKFTKSH